MCGSTRADSCRPAGCARVISISLMRTGGYETHRGLARCRIVPATASATKSAEAATYAQPRNGFLPPIQETVEMTIDFVPEYGFTG
jgi:hypothetical protein